MGIILENCQDLYANALVYWANHVSDIDKSPLTRADPLWNDHKSFHGWLLKTYNVRVKMRNLNVVLEFDSPQSRTLFVLRFG